MTPDIIAKIRFFPTSQGGRENPVQGKSYSCPLFFEKEGFDCRLILNGNCLELDMEYEVPIKFLFIEYAYKEIKIGREFHLWEGRDIAKGSIIEIINNILPSNF